MDSELQVTGMNCRSQEEKKKEKTRRVAPPLLSQALSLERESITKGETDFFLEDKSQILK